MPQVIRDAVEADMAGIIPFFRAIVEAGETYAYPADLTDSEITALWLVEPPSRCVVALDENERVVGSATMGPNRPGRGSHIATASFMVDPDVRGKGIGRALGEEAIRWAKASGFHGMQFNAVVETNAGAVKLWRSLGFEILTTVPEAFRHKQLGLVGLNIMYQRFEKP